MASDKILDSNFNWGDTVRIKSNAPKRYKPGSLGSICGIRIIDSVEVAKHFDQLLNSKLYLIEFGDGHALEIPQSFLTTI